jgi:hypothetical protein
MGFNLSDKQLASSVQRRLDFWQARYSPNASAALHKTFWVLGKWPLTPDPDRVRYHLSKNGPLVGVDETWTLIPMSVPVIRPVRSARLMWFRHLQTELGVPRYAICALVPSVDNPLFSENVQSWETHVRTSKNRRWLMTSESRANVEKSTSARDQWITCERRKIDVGSWPNGQ